MLNIKVLGVQSLGGTKCRKKNLGEQSSEEQGCEDQSYQGTGFRNIKWPVPIKSDHINFHRTAQLFIKLCANIIDKNEHPASLN